MDKNVQIVFNSIQLNTLDSASGIFFGTNIQSGWSTHSKRNFGFGEAHFSTLLYSSNSVVDNDLIDAPIDDRDVIYSNSLVGGNNLADIKFKSLNTNALETSCAIAVGENLQNSWASHQKNNFGQGESYGAILTSNNSQTVVDNDLIDSPINDQDFKPSVVIGR